MAVTVESFTQTDGKATREALPPGTRVLVGLEGKRTVFSADGMPVEGTPAYLLSRVLKIRPADYPVDLDAMLGGPATPRHVGDAWPVNAKAMAASSRYFGNTVDDSAITGEVRLTGVESVDGRPCLNVEYDYDVSSYTPAAVRGALPTTRPVPEHAAAEGHGQYLLPVDPSAACVQTSTAYTTRRTVANRAAGGRRYTTEYVTRERTAFRLLPPAPATTRASTRPASS
jgi:hypothetical protein